MEIAILDSNFKALKAGEVGEICCRGPAVCAGYHDNPDATEEAMEGGWFHTGDLGYVDERGLVYITGRSSDMYISGGANVYPREIEEVLLTHPGVSEVAVFGVPDEKWGETGVAIVVRNPHTEIADEAALYQHLDLSIYLELDFFLSRINLKNAPPTRMGVIPTSKNQLIEKPS